MIVTFLRPYSSQLLAQSQSKASSKKRKRLDKYIVRTYSTSIDTQEIDTLRPGKKIEEGRARRAVRKACVSGVNDILVLRIAASDSCVKEESDRTAEHTSAALIVHAGHRKNCYSAGQAGQGRG
jgi:hypothetical protein